MWGEEIEKKCNGVSGGGWKTNEDVTRRPEKGFKAERVGFACC